MIIVDGSDEEEEDVFVFTSTENEIPYLPFDEQTSMETESRDCVVFNREDRSGESSCGYERGRAVFCEAQSTINLMFSPLTPLLTGA